MSADRKRDDSVEPGLFKLVFSRESLANQDSAVVKERLASMINVDVSFIEACLEGRKKLYKGGLDFYTANLYLKKFKDIGAVFSLQPMAVCPYCKNPVEIGKSCTECDSTGEPEGENTDSINRADVFEYSQQKMRNKAAFGIGGGIVFLIAVFFINSILFKIFNFNLLWPYLLTGLPMTYGCVYYSRSKGYTGWMGLFGLTTLFGLGILFLLPDRTIAIENREFSVKKTLIGVMMICISVYWAGDKYFTYRELTTFIDSIHEYYLSHSEGKDQSLETIAYRSRKILDRGFSLLDKYQDDLAPRYYFMLANGLFDVPSQMFGALEFQYYLRWFDNGDFSPLNTSEDVYQMKREIMAYLEKKVKELDEARVSEVYYKWRSLTLNDGYPYFLQMVYEQTEGYRNHYHRAVKTLERLFKRYYELYGKLPENGNELLFTDKENMLPKNNSHFRPKKMHWIKKYMSFTVYSEYSQVDILVNNPKLKEVDGSNVRYGIIVEKPEDDEDDVNDVNDVNIRLVRIGGSMRDCFIIGGFMDINITWKHSGPGLINSVEYMRMIEEAEWFKKDERRDYKYIFE